MAVCMFSVLREGGPGSPVLVLCVSVASTTHTLTEPGASE